MGDLLSLAVILVREGTDLGPREVAGHVLHHLLLFVQREIDHALSLHRSSFLDFLAETDPPALAGAGGFLRLFSKIIEVERPAHGESFLQRAKRLAEAS